MQPNNPTIAQRFGLIIIHAVGRTRKTERAEEIMQNCLVDNPMSKPLKSAKELALRAIDKYQANTALSETLKDDLLNLRPAIAEATDKEPLLRFIDLCWPLPQ